METAQHHECDNLLPVLQFADLFMEDMKGRYKWGYSLAQLLAGIQSCHPNYPEKLLQEKAYTADVIHGMLNELAEGDKPRFKHEVLDKLKDQHYVRLAKSSPVKIDAGLKEICVKNEGRAILLCGGLSVKQYKNAIRCCIDDAKLAVISVNNPETPFKIDGIFFGNRRRILKYYSKIPANIQVILTPDIHKAAVDDFSLKHVSRVNSMNMFPKTDDATPPFVPINSAIESIFGLVQVGFRELFICGMDGYSLDTSYYYDERDGIQDLKIMKKQNQEIEAELFATRRWGEQLGFCFSIITPTLFEKFYDSNIIEP